MLVWDSWAVVDHVDPDRLVVERSAEGEACGGGGVVEGVEDDGCQRLGELVDVGKEYEVFGYLGGADRACGLDGVGVGGNVVEKLAEVQRGEIEWLRLLRRTPRNQPCLEPPASVEPDQVRSLSAI